MGESFICCVKFKVALRGMITRRKSLSRRYERRIHSGERSFETFHVRAEANLGTRRASTVQISTASDSVVQTAVFERRSSSVNGIGMISRDTESETPKMKRTRRSASINSAERRATTVDSSVSRPAKATGENTPLRSADGSLSGKSKTYRRNGRGKGSRYARHFRNGG